MPVTNLKLFRLDGLTGTQPARHERKQQIKMVWIEKDQVEEKRILTLLDHTCMGRMLHSFHGGIAVFQWGLTRSSTPPQCRIGWHKATSVPVAKTKKITVHLKKCSVSGQEQYDLDIKVTKRRCLVSTTKPQVRLGEKSQKRLLNFLPAAINGFVQLISHCRYMRWGIMTKCQSWFLFSFLSIIQSIKSTKKKILDPYKPATLMPFI